jgi:hypothetical protein
MENLINYINPHRPNQKLLNLIKLSCGKVVLSPSKWLSDRWFLRETGFEPNLTCIEVSSLKNPMIGSNTFIGEKYLNHKVIRFLKDSSYSLDSALKEIDFLSIIDPDNAFEFLQQINFSIHKIKYFSIAINPLKTKDRRQNMRDIKGFMNDKAKFKKRNRTELLYEV